MKQYFVEIFIDFDRNNRSREVEWKLKRKMKNGKNKNKTRIRLVQLECNSRLQFLNDNVFTSDILLEVLYSSGKKAKGLVMHGDYDLGIEKELHMNLKESSHTLLIA